MLQSGRASTSTTVLLGIDPTYYGLTSARTDRNSPIHFQVPGGGSNNYHNLRTGFSWAPGSFRQPRTVGRLASNQKLRRQSGSQTINDDKGQGPDQISNSIALIPLSSHILEASRGSETGSAQPRIIVQRQMRRTQSASAWSV